MIFINKKNQNKQKTLSSMLKPEKEKLDSARKEEKMFLKSRKSMSYQRC